MTRLKSSQITVLQESATDEREGLQINRGQTLYLAGDKSALQLLAAQYLADLLVRELNAAIESGRSMSGRRQRYLERLNSGIGLDYYHELRQFEIELINCALKLTDGNQTAAARLLRLKTTTLHAKIKQFKILLHPPGQPREE